MTMANATCLMSRSTRRWRLGLIGAIGAIALGAPQSPAAEQISATYGPIKVSIQIKDLETYARTGQLSSELSTYASLVTPQQLADIRESLQQRVAVNPILIRQLAKSRTGEIIFKRLGLIVQTGGGANGAIGIQTALLQAVDSKDGLTALNLLRQFPDMELRLDVDLGIKIATEANRLFAQTGRMVALIDRLAMGPATTPPKPDPKAPPSLPPVPSPLSQEAMAPGPYKWQQQKLNLVDANRSRSVPTDLYLPLKLPPALQAAPVVVISHGVASDRSTFAYLAQHLASHGFVVAVPEHIGSNALKFKQFFDGVGQPPEPREALDRPQDVTFLLDELTRLNRQDPQLKGRMNPQQAAIIGQSFGGYTALALAGATLNFDTLNQACTKGEPSTEILNLSLLLQCRLQELEPRNYNLQDSRIKATIAINPFASKVFGRTGLSKVTTPTLIIASGQDIVAPAADEQFYPFTWLTIPQRYLVLFNKGTHFSTLQEPKESVLPVPTGAAGPDPKLAQSYTNVLSLAFLKTHLTQQPNYATLLTAQSVQALSKPTMPVTLLRQLSAGDLDNALIQPNR
jgi:predicted dienelactone hydrolase